MSIDVDRLKAEADLVGVVGRYVQLRKAGPEYSGCCPFHEERTPSFTVNPKKGFVHCFGCGAHHDVIGFLMAITGCTFQEACEQLGARDYAQSRVEVKRQEDAPLDVKWVALVPVPDDAPDLLADNGWTVPIWNPKRCKTTRLKPSRVDAYLDAEGRVMGYVLRADIKDRETGAAVKWTPQVTWCVGPDGKRSWCLQPFPEPRPLYGLDALVAKADAPVLMPEGEKCRVAGAGAFAQYACVSWPGGSNGIAKVDLAPLAGRDVVLWPDADEAGRKAMLGWRNDAGEYRPGLAQLLVRAGVRSLRMVDPQGMPKGWDLADALADGWTPRQLAAWAANRVVELDVVRGGQ